ncbi:MAG TPA: hypothetical protein VJ740_17735, partial [Hyphomicrobiaceae bacterium]|nr:hypothetical protein [Hyphomicrobiaceae bacterium]
MRGWVFAVAVALCAGAAVLPASAQNAGGGGGKGEAADVAEQLVIQMQRWYEALAAEGRLPSVFTGITAEPRQLIVELDSLSFDADKRRDFLIWLGRRYKLVAYAYAARNEMPKTAREGTLEVHASSSAKNVSAAYSIVRRDGGKIVHVRTGYRSDAASDPSNPHPLFGLHRSLRGLGATRENEFEQTWKGLESKVVWRR